MAATSAVTVASSRSNTVEDAGQRLLDEGEVRREALRQRRGAFLAEAREIGIDQVAVEGALHVGLDLRHDAIGQPDHGVEREALDGRHHHHEERPEDDHVAPLDEPAREAEIDLHRRAGAGAVREGLEGGLDHDRIEARRRRDDDDQEQDAAERAQVRADPIAPEPGEERERIARRQHVGGPVTSFRTGMPRRTHTGRVAERQIHRVAGRLGGGASTSTEATAP